MTRQNNLIKWTEGVDEFNLMTENLKLGIEVDDFGGLFLEWNSIRPRISPYEFLYKKYDVVKLIHKHYGRPLKKKRNVQ